MDQTLLPPKDQDENKNIVNNSSAFSGLSDPSSDLQPQPASQSSPVSAFKPSVNLNAQSSGQQFKLDKNEVQGPKPPLVSRGGSRFALFAIVFVVIVVAGIGGYYYFSKNGADAPQAIDYPNTSNITITPSAIDKDLDSDKDGLPDAIEKILGTYVTKADSDNDGYTDLQEIKNGYSPLIAGAAGKYTEEKWSIVKGSIKIENREFYEREFGAAAVSPSPSSAVSFNCGVSTVSDIDNNIYNTVKIGEQCWLKENLKVTKNPAGELITRYCYDNDSKICDTDGGLYDWNTAMNSSAGCNGTGASQPQCATPVQGICPNGWHIPSHYEWTALEKNVGANPDTFVYDGTIPTALGTADEAKNLVGDGSSGFNAIPAGIHTVEDKGAGFMLRGRDAEFWSSTIILVPSTIEKEGIFKISLLFNSSNLKLMRSVGDKKFGISLRCLKD